MPCERCQQESEHITGRERQWLIDADVPERFLPDSARWAQPIPLRPGLNLAAVATIACACNLT